MLEGNLEFTDMNDLVILQMRLYALYSLDKRILALMATCFIMATAASATVMGTVLSNITGNSQLNLTFRLRDADFR